MVTTAVEAWEKLLGVTIKNPPRFLEGVNDCVKGDRRENMGDDYELGYGSQYQIEQIKNDK